MRKKITPLLIISIVSFVLFCMSCTKPVKQEIKHEKIKNTFKSVSLFQDSIPIEPHELRKILTIMNVAIDSIGYPDAGYKLWEVSTDSPDFRYMVEGYWPDKATYTLIHEHELYVKAGEKAKPMMKGLKSTWYNRFTRIK